MIRMLFAAWAVALPAAAASPSFDAFAGVCGDTRADFVAVGVAANAQGWRPTEVTGDAAMPGVTIADHLARDKKIAGAPAVLAAWRGANKAGVQLSDCKVRLGKTDFASTVAAAQAWTGFAPQDVTAAKATFKLADSADGRRAVAASDYDAAAGGGGLEILTVSGDRGGVIVDLLKIKK